MNSKMILIKSTKQNKRVNTNTIMMRYNQRNKNIKYCVKQIHRLLAYICDAQDKTAIKIKLWSVPTNILNRLEGV